MIAELGLSASLWIVWGGESVGDPMFGIEACHLFVGEVHPSVRDDGMREPKATYDVLPEEVNYLLSHDVGEWHRFYSLGKVVCTYQ